MARNRSAWTTSGAIALAGDAGAAAVEQAIAKIEVELSPVPVATAERALWKDAMDERLRRLAVKVAPGFSPDQANAWRDVMTDALADLPAFVALTAAKRALHRPMKFMNEIEGVIRELAADVAAEREEAKWRLNRLLGDMERIANPPVALPPPADTPMTAADIAEANAIFQRLGIRTRYRSDGTSYEPEPPSQDEQGNEIPEVKAA